MPLAKLPKLPNIWSRRIERYRKGTPRPKWTKTVTFDYQQAAEKCHIKLHYLNAAKKRKVVRCTVAQAIRDHLRPGKWIVPRRIPPKVFQALDKSKTSYVDYRNQKPYTTVLEYNLVKLNINANGPQPKVESRGPQLFQLDCFPDDPMQAHVIVSEAFKTLSRGRTSTFAIVTNYLFDRPKGFDLATQQNGPFQQQGESHGTDESLSLATNSRRGPTHSDEDDSNTSGPAVDNVPQEVSHIENTQQEEGKGRRHSACEAHPIDDEASTKSSAPGALNNEDDAAYRRIQSYQESRAEVRGITEQNNSTPDHTDDQLGSSDQQSGEEPSAMQHTSQSLFSGGDSTGADATEHTQEASDDEHHLVLDATAEQFEDRPDAKDFEQGSSNKSTNSETISIKEPFARQIMDNSLVLTTRRTPGYRHLQGTARILAWASKHMPHLWPNVITACMPPGNRIEMAPRTLGTSIQYVIAPAIDLAVKATLRDLRFRRPEKWV